jgi:hypothetical protein
MNNRFDDPQTSRVCVHGRLDPLTPVVQMHDFPIGVYFSIQMKVFLMICGKAIRSLLVIFLLVPFAFPITKPLVVVHFN